ncbi:YMGG-like glycine zipper-containing protein [Flectobacillus major]|jgi:hypothetical protein|uniref:YMGG-like glycine zipper-containing protein n=1 Tax=Flectobacillus major TaxID=103 RepID=UPI000402BE5E|nr:lipoprotein [Flectobacillus major]
MKKLLILFTAMFYLAACQNKSNSEADIQLAKQAVIDSMKMQSQLQATKQAVIDSMKNQALIQQESSEKAITEQASTSSKVTGANAVGYKSDEKAATSTPVANTPAKAKKKKMSTVAKGAIIGAGVGAVTGAIVNKRNRGAGAVIGGVLGAGAGAATGAIIDKKKQN